MTTHGKLAAGEPLWVFGYGSLVWNPEFPFAKRELAVLDGYHRWFCMWSIHHRGTVENPGLVLALDHDPAAACNGVVFEVAPEHAAKTLEDLRERELVSSAYLERWLPVRRPSGELVEAVVYIVDREHEQYTGPLELEAQAQTIAHAHGGRGPNHEYLANTAAHLRELGLHDAELDWLEARVAEIQQT